MFYASTALNLWVASLLTLVLVAAAAVDVRCGKIPNLITFPAILLFLGFHLLAGGATGFLGSLAGLAAGLTAMLAPYCMGRLLGAGDVKLMAAVGAALGVADDDGLGAGVGQHLGGEIAGVGACSGGVAVLPAGANAGARPASFCVA